MSEKSLKLARNPIVEAMVDIDCDLPPTIDLGGCKTAAKAAFCEHYPLLEYQISEGHQIVVGSEEPLQHHVKRGIAALRFQNSEDNQLIQIRTQGFTFNRLRPYTTLDDYIGEIERCWKLFVDITKPTLIKSITLRYINRILLPLTKGEELELSKFFQVSPQLPEQSNLCFTGFLNQRSAVEIDTGNLANIILTAQQPDLDHLTIIFDIGVSHPNPGQVEDWVWILSKIMSLRSLKNRIFQNTLTEKCLKLFQTLD